MKTGKLFAYGLLLLGCIWFLRNPNAAAEVESKRATGSVSNKNTSVKAFMRKKLIAADQILEGLSTPDMKLVQKGATSMILMNKEAMWATYKSPSYVQDSADFVRSAERLVRLAKEKDLEGASLTYAQLTIQCVNCHRRVRREDVATLNATDSEISLIATSTLR